MTEFKILAADLPRVIHVFHANVDPEDKWACVALLDARIRSERLPKDSRLQGWHQRRGWITYSVPLVDPEHH